MSSSYALPLGWIIATDPSTGKSYFANPTTGESSWVPPQTNTLSSAGEGIYTQSKFPVLSAKRSMKEAKESGIEPMEMNLTGGLIADLVKAQYMHRRHPNQVLPPSHTHLNQNSGERYIPLNLIELPELISIPHQEKARIETRMISLKETLSKI